MVCEGKDDDAKLECDDEADPDPTLGLAAHVFDPAALALLLPGPHAAIVGEDATGPVASPPSPQWQK